MLSSFDKINPLVDYKPHFYFRYNEKTGIKELFRVSALCTYDSRFYKMDGSPRKSIKVKGKRYYKYE